MLNCVRCGARHQESGSKCRRCKDDDYVVTQAVFDYTPVMSHTPTIDYSPTSSYDSPSFDSGFDGGSSGGGGGGSDW